MIHLVVDARAIRPGATGIGHYTAGLLRGFDALGLGEVCTTTALRLSTVDQSQGWLGDFWKGLRSVRVADVDVDYESHPGGEFWMHGGGMDRAVQATGGNALISPAFVCPYGKRPYARVVVIHDALVWEMPENYPRAFATWLRMAASLSMRSAEAVVVTSPTTRWRMETELDILPMGKAAVAAPGVDHALFRPEEGDLRPVGERPLIVCPGSFEPRKNVGLLFEALRQPPLREMRPRLMLLHNGALPAGSEGLDVEVVAPRGPEHMAEMLRSANVVALPSKAEGFGLSLLEAMACGTPVVASDIAVFQWLAENGKCARLAPPDAAGSWSHAIAAVLDGNDSEVSARRERGLVRASEFNWTLAARQLWVIAKAALDRGDQSSA